MLTPSTSLFPQKAMLLAAGLGERLRPLTLTTPKPLIQLGAYRLIDYNLMLLKHFGIREVMINLYHLGEQIREYLGSEKWGMKLYYSEEKKILGTAGGVRQALDFFEGKTCLILNADVLIDLNLANFFAFHRSQSSKASLVVTEASQSVTNWIFSDPSHHIHTIGPETNQPNLKKQIFTGVQLIDSSLIASLPEQEKLCLVQDLYIPHLKEGKTVNAFKLKGYWRDVGTWERYESVKEELEKEWPFTNFGPIGLASA